MSVKGDNGLKDIDTLSYSEFSYLQTDSKTLVDKPEAEVIDNSNGKEVVSFYNPLKEQNGITVDAYLKGKSFGDRDGMYEPSLKDAVIIAMANNDSGFNAVAFKDKNGQVIICYRGTEDLKDWEDNGQTMVSAQSDQSEDAQQFFDVVKDLIKDDKPKPPISLVGHSKGGELAIKVALENMDDIYSVNTLSAQPPNTKQLGYTQEQLNEILEENRDKINLSRMEGDIVPYAGKNTINDYTRVIDSEKYNKWLPNWLLNAHKLKYVTIDENGDFIKSSGESLTTKIIQLKIESFLTDLQYNFLISEIAYEFVKNGLIEIGQEILDIAQKTKEVIERIIDKTKDIGKEVVNFIIVNVEEIANTFKSALNAFKDYFNNNNSPKATSQIEVDTQHLKDLAQRLENVRNRLVQLDGDLNYLYLTESLAVIKNLLKANLLLPSKRKVNGCIDYLEGTAIAFEKAEKNIKALV